MNTKFLKSLVFAVVLALSTFTFAFAETNSASGKSQAISSIQVASPIAAMPIVNLNDAVESAAFNRSPDSSFINFISPQKNIAQQFAGEKFASRYDATTHAIPISPPNICLNKFDPHSNFTAIKRLQNRTLDVDKNQRLVRRE